MDITKYPQYQMYIFTLFLLMKRTELIPNNCDERCINATIINRAYYSSYLLCELWLEDIKKFKTLKPWDFSEDEKTISEHKQVRNALFNFNEKKIGSELTKLFHLRAKADYNPFADISQNEVDSAIDYMKYIADNLNFEKYNE